MIKAIAMIAMLAISGCSMFATKHHDYCAAYRPILISKQDTLTDGTAQQILAANKTWSQLCGR